jgi:hypothetical protein
MLVKQSSLRREQERKHHLAEQEMEVVADGLVVSPIQFVMESKVLLTLS